jgi:hypothetical protein
LSLRLLVCLPLLPQIPSLVCDFVGISRARAEEQPFRQKQKYKTKKIENSSGFSPKNK